MQHYGVASGLLTGNNFEPVKPYGVSDIFCYLLKCDALRGIGWFRVGMLFFYVKSIISLTLFPFVTLRDNGLIILNIGKVKTLRVLFCMKGLQRQAWRNSQVVL